jgi:hypothetical protein
MSDNNDDEDEKVEEGTAEEIDFDNLEEDVDEDGNRKPDSFISIIADFLGNLNIKLLILLFLSYIFIMSDLFLDKVLSKVTDATKHRDQLTPKGTFINGLLLVMLYMTADLLIKSRII